jgi:hypothetical protein
MSPLHDLGLMKERGLVEAVLGHRTRAYCKTPRSIHWIAR